MYRLITKLLILLFSLIVAGGLFYTQSRTSTPTTVSSHEFQKVLDYARENLPQTGQLEVKSDGFVYLKVDDRYIRNLYPMLELRRDGFRAPPYFRTKEAPGAHISVFYENEHVVPVEKGQTFHFTVKNIAIVKASKYTSYAVLEVDSPELEKLREKYGKSPKLFGHDFHISIAKKTVRKPL